MAAVDCMTAMNGKAAATLRASKLASRANVARIVPVRRNVGAGKHVDGVFQSFFHPETRIILLSTGQTFPVDTDRIVLYLQSAQTAPLLSSRPKRRK